MRVRGSPRRGTSRGTVARARARHEAAEHDQSGQAGEDRQDEKVAPSDSVDEQAGWRSASTRGIEKSGEERILRGEKRFSVRRRSSTPNAAVQDRQSGTRTLAPNTVAAGWANLREQGISRFEPSAGCRNPRRDRADRVRQETTSSAPAMTPACIVPVADHVHRPNPVR